MSIYEFQHKALLRLVATMFAAAGIVVGGAPVARLPLSVRKEISRVLLPMESAVRRLIFYRMKRMETPPEDAPEVETTPSAGDGSALGRQKRKRKREATRKGTRAPVFWLFDTLKWFAELSDPRRRPPKGPGPRISSFDGSDPPREPAKEKRQRDPDDAVKLCRRLQAVMAALSDIDAQALRLKKIIAKRKAGRKRKPTIPMRPGFAPGSRRKRMHEIDDILYECDLLVNRPIPSAV